MIIRFEGVIYIKKLGRIKALNITEKEKKLLRKREIA